MYGIVLDALTLVQLGGTHWHRGTALANEYRGCPLQLFLH